MPGKKKNVEWIKAITFFFHIFQEYNIGKFLYRYCQHDAISEISLFAVSIIQLIQNK